MHTITITKNEIVAHDIHKIYARVMPERPLTFKAGQFCMVHFPHKEKTLPRAFSFGSDAADAHNIIFYVKILRDAHEHVASPFFENCQPGDTLSIDHPAGLMTLPETLPDTIVYLATTTGVAPFLSHLYDIARIHPQQRIDMIFGCRYEDDMFAQKELSELQSLLPNFRVTTTLTQPSSSWNGGVGRVTDYLTSYTPEQNILFYLCGNKFMIIDARKKLSQTGFDIKNIKFEIFF